MAEYHIAIAGISSKLALKIAAECLRQPYVKIRGSSRNIANLPDFLSQSPRVTLIECGAYDIEPLRSLVQGCNVVVCCYYADNKTMVEGQKLLIKICEEYNIPRYLASDYTADYTKLDWGDIIIKDPMKEIHDYLETRPKVKGVHVLVGLLMETFWAYFDVWHPEQTKLRYWGTGSELWDLTTYQTAAQYVAAVILDPTAEGIKRFVGHRTSIRDMALDVKAVLGIEPMLENAGSLQEIQSKITLEKEEQNPVAAGIYYTLVGKITLGDQLDNAKYPGIRSESFRGFLRRQVETSTPSTSTSNAKMS